MSLRARFWVSTLFAEHGELYATTGANPEGGVRGPEKLHFPYSIT